MCFSWPPWVRGSELDGPEHLVRAFGPILAPWVDGRAGNAYAGRRTDLQSAGRVFTRFRQMW
jgi:hypothetical protein